MNKNSIQDSIKNGDRKQIEKWDTKTRIVLVEIAFEAAVPFGRGSGDGEPGEEFRERTRRRRPVHFAESVDQILSRYVAPIHFLWRFFETLAKTQSSPNEQRKKTVGTIGSKSAKR